MILKILFPFLFLFSSLLFLFFPGRAFSLLSLLASQAQPTWASQAIQPAWTADAPLVWIFPRSDCWDPPGSHTFSSSFALPLRRGQRQGWRRGGGAPSPATPLAPLFKQAPPRE